MLLLTTYLEFASCTTLASVTSKRSFSNTQRVRRFRQLSCSWRVSMLEPFRVGPVGLISEMPNRNYMEMGSIKRTDSSQLFFFVKTRSERALPWYFCPSIYKFISGFSYMVRSNFLKRKKKQAYVVGFNFLDNSTTDRFTPNHNLQILFSLSRQPIHTFYKTEPRHHCRTQQYLCAHPNLNSVRTTHLDSYLTITFYLECNNLCRQCTASGK